MESRGCRQGPVRRENAFLYCANRLAPRVPTVPKESTSGLPVLQRLGIAFDQFATRLDGELIRMHGYTKPEFRARRVEQRTQALGDINGRVREEHEMLPFLKK